MKAPQSTGFVNQAGGEVSLDADNPENRLLASRLVFRHARNNTERRELLEMPGLLEAGK